MAAESADNQPVDRVDSIAPRTATPLACVDLALRLAEVRANDVVLDIGCNDGRVLIRALQHAGETSRSGDENLCKMNQDQSVSMNKSAELTYSNVHGRGIGVEIVEEACYVARRAVAEAGLSESIEIIHGNILDMGVNELGRSSTDLIRSADVIFLFMALKPFDKLSTMIASVVRPGTRIVTYLFPLHTSSSSTKTTVQTIPLPLAATRHTVTRTQSAETSASGTETKTETAISSLAFTSASFASSSSTLTETIPGVSPSSPSSPSSPYHFKHHFKHMQSQQSHHPHASDSSSIFNSWFIRSESLQNTRPNGIGTAQFTRVYLYIVK